MTDIAELDARVPDWVSVRQIMRRGKMGPHDREHLMDDWLNEPTEFTVAWRAFKSEIKAAILSDWARVKALFRRT